MIDGVIHEQHDDKILAKWLWLQEDNSSNVRKGYMRQILKVYRLSVLVSQEQQPPAKKRKTSSCLEGLATAVYLRQKILS